MAKKKENLPPVCLGCQAWESFGDKCWFFWEEKKECANHTEGFKSVKENFEIDSLYF